MTDQSTAAGQQPGVVGDGQQEPKHVSYETHERLLREKKKAQEELEILRTKEKQREEDDAKKRGDYEALIKTRDEELGKTKQELASIHENITKARKLTAILSATGSAIDQKWHQFIDIAQVAVHPETGEVDQMSVTKVVEGLRKSWPEMFKTSAQTLPPDAPLGNSAGKITRSEWLKLSAKGSKEMQKWTKDQIIDD